MIPEIALNYISHLKPGELICGYRDESGPCGGKARFGFYFTWQGFCSNGCKEKHEQSFMFPIITCEKHRVSRDEAMGLEIWKHALSVIQEENLEIPQDPKLNFIDIRENNLGLS